MKHRFLLHSLSHTILVVDITSVGLPNEIYPRTGKAQSVPTLRFRSWEDAEQYLLESGASRELLESESKALKTYGVTVLTIV